MRNALDHSFNPLLGIMQMLYVTRIGGKVVLNHMDNEAVNAQYQGLHQWNLQVVGENFLIWNKHMKVDVNELLSSFCNLQCLEYDSVNGEHDNLYS